MIDFEIGFVVGALSAVFVYCCYRAWELWGVAEGETEEGVLHVEQVSTAAPNFTDEYKKASDAVNEVLKSEFAVSGKPHRVPWNIRKRELTEAAKKKRRQYESFQEID